MNDLLGGTENIHNPKMSKIGHHTLLRTQKHFHEYFPSQPQVFVTLNWCLLSSLGGLCFNSFHGIIFFIKSPKTYLLPYCFSYAYVVLIQHIRIPILLNGPIFLISQGERLEIILPFLPFLGIH